MAKFKSIDKMLAKKHPALTIAFLGDSVTQGCFEIYKTSANTLETVYDYKSAYSTRVREILNILYPSVQVNIINSGISGDNVVNGNYRLEEDVLKYNPDIVVVSFGLNDSVGGLDNLPNYKNALSSIFTRLKERGIEVIFLTQNFMNTKTAPAILFDDFFRGLAEMFANVQNSGLLKAYFDQAKEVCLEHGVSVCDGYHVWETMQNAGVDTTALLSNDVNHPIREYHYYIAIKLIEIILGL